MAYARAMMAIMLGLCLAAAHAIAAPIAATRAPSIYSAAPSIYSAARRATVPANFAAEDPISLERPTKVWLSQQSEDDEAPTKTLGESIQQGEVVVCVPQVASDDEMRALLAAGVAACDLRLARTGAAPRTGRNRFPVSDPQAFTSETVLTCEEILLRVGSNLRARDLGRLAGVSRRLRLHAEEAARR